jgi:hypothetical protein
MADTRIILSGLWVAVMLTYLWGDVLRIMTGDYKEGDLLGGVQPTQRLWHSNHSIERTTMRDLPIACNQSDLGGNS